MFLLNSIKNIDETNTQFAYRVLKYNIMSLNLRPGIAISENEISAQLGISRTPVREAISNLRKENLIEVYPNKGTFISRLDSNLIEEAQFMRSILESEIIKLACINFPESFLKKLEDNIKHQKHIVELNFSPLEFFSLDNKFHEIIFEGCNKLNIWNQISSISSHFNRIRLLDAEKQTTTLLSYSQHEDIFNAIKNKDINNCDSMIKKHILSFKDRINELSCTFPTFFKEQS
ncbi:MAG: GntR family transcriptional regulator [Fusobacteriaceae bacterium]